MDHIDPAAVTHPAPLAWMDGEVVPAAQATVPLNDDGFLRGDAVFEAALVQRGRTHALERHLARLHRSAAALDLDVPEEQVRRAVRDLLLAWGEEDGSVRVFVTRGGAVRGLATVTNWPATMSMAVLDMPWRTVISGVKTLSYAANQWAVRQAHARGADDALIVSDGQVHESPTGAIVLIHGDLLTTPDPARLPILASVSITVLEEVADLQRGVPDLDDLLAADELVVVSATRPCMPVHALVLPDGRRHDLPGPGPVTAALQERLAAHIAATLDPAPTT